ncbi:MULTISPECIES: carbohydrate ABC transporter permease [Oerskovia]|uniref:L-arabinose transport system permease protein AraQ n=1 Tax=Oerskovia enterophila TaxID=43678 RepID=A0A163R0W7_9CELL|nr:MULTISPECIES: carbohydrate ABC transporter permease [Oerskovia]KRC42064.1 ABC transporter permease [Oerskovia sp. Root22]KZM34739.1 L-arabinose transport system permease protein AraQ [Oerskovia enterophila]
MTQTSTVQASQEAPVKKTRTGRRRPASSSRARTSPTLSILMTLMLLYAVVPLLWLVINSTKTNGGLFNSFGLWFADDFALGENLTKLFSYQGGIYSNWLLNTVLYAGVGGVGATILATLGGYGLAKFSFPGRKWVLAGVIGAMTVPLTALAVPTFLMFSRLGLVNTAWAVIIPALASPFGLYLMYVYSQDSVPESLLEAARLDGASELRTFLSVSLRLLTPGFITVLLFTVVATWNNYFLPLIMLTDPKLYPLTVGLNQWSAQAGSSGASEPVYNLVLTGSLVAIIPLIIVFLFLQRYWQSGLAAGAVKQ